MLTKVVERTRNIVRLHLVQPKRWKSWNRGEDCISRTGRGGCCLRDGGWRRIQGNLRKVEGESHSQRPAIRRGQIPKTQGIRLARCDRRYDVLVNRVVVARAGSGRSEEH